MARPSTGSPPYAARVTHPYTRLAWLAATVLVLVLWTAVPVAFGVTLDAAQHAGYGSAVALCLGQLGAQTLDDRRARDRAEQVGRAFGLSPERTIEALDVAAAIARGLSHPALERRHLPIVEVNNAHR